MFVRFCGINGTHSKSFKIERPDGFGDYLFLRMKTPTRFYINGEIYDAAPNDIILYSKGAPQFYEELKVSPHIDDFMFFDVNDKADQEFINQLSLKFNQVLRLPYIHPFIDIHQMICFETINQNELHKESINYLLKYFLIKLSESMNTDYSNCDHTMFERFNELRLTLYRSPAQKWTVNKMADYVNLSPSYFQSIYKKLFHISCMADLFTSRMNYAKELLLTTPCSVNEIAAKCGYESNVYFSRHFKRKVGVTPSEYRNLHNQRMYI